MKKVRIIFTALLISFFACMPVKAQGGNYPTYNYTIKPGDTLWMIAVRNEIGVPEIVTENPQVANPNMIYAGSVLRIPDMTQIKTAEHEVVRLVNIERAKHGLPALTANWQLSRVSRMKSEDMRDKNYFSHQSPTYGSPFTMIKNFGINFSAAGENIAMGQQTPGAVVSAWMNSPGHRANILSRNYTEMGVGYTIKGPYWTQMFISR